MNFINKDFCYRITHIHNLPIILKNNGIICNNNTVFDSNYITIGNKAIMDVRSGTNVRLQDNNYGKLSDYVPCYFTPKSIMLFNILTGFHATVPKISASEILIISFKISTLTTLANQQLWFFTDGQANDRATKHYNNLLNIDNIDWESIQSCNFSKKKDDMDRARRYQAEFLVKDKIPLHAIETFHVYDDISKKYLEDILTENQVNMKVEISKNYYF